MAMNHLLTAGSLQQILSSESHSFVNGFQDRNEFCPIVLVQNARLIPSNAVGGPARWKVVLTDGRDVATGMLATQLAPLTDYVTNTVGLST